MTTKGRKRNPPRAMTAAEFNRTGEHMLEIGQGIWVFTVFPSAVALLDATLSGDPEQLADCRVVGGIIRRIAAGERPACLICGAVSPPAGFVILRPPYDALIASGERKVDVLCSPLCESCASRPDLHDAIVAAFRSSILPDAHQIFPSEPGRA